MPGAKQTNDDDDVGPHRLDESRLTDPKFRFDLFQSVVRQHIFFLPGVNSEYRSGFPLLREPFLDEAVSLILEYFKAARHVAGKPLQKDLKYPDNLVHARLRCTHRELFIWLICFLDAAFQSTPDLILTGEWLTVEPAGHFIRLRFNVPMPDDLRSPSIKAGTHVATVSESGDECTLQFEVLLDETV